MHNFIEARLGAQVKLTVAITIQAFIFGQRQYASVLKQQYVIIHICTVSVTK